jgi:tRNA nucleotidyltransferase (CCA-adding enzyme)
MQFLARFEFSAAPETIELCATIGTEGLPAERLCEEWRKLIVQGVKPSLGLRFLRDCGWVRHYPELNALIGCPQDPHWHPEGDVWEHVNHCLDAFARARVGDPWEDFVVGLAVLLHDVGKPLVTVMEDGRWRSRGHDLAGLPVARAFLERLTRQTAVFEEVLPLIAAHHQPHNLWQGHSGAGAVRRLSGKVGRLDRLARVVTADQSGRPPKVADLSAVEWLMARADELQVRDSAPKRIVLGRHLIALGQPAGPGFRELLDAIYEAQLDGAFSDEAGGIEFARAKLAETA